MSKPIKKIKNVMNNYIFFPKKSLQWLKFNLNSILKIHTIKPLDIKVMKQNYFAKK